MAVADNMAIGRNNALLWHLSEDLQYFKRQTLGFPVIMGYNTFLSIGAKPLPKRLNIVISDRPVAGGGSANLLFVESLDKAYEAARQSEESRKKFECCGAALACSPSKCFVIGGAATYAEAMQSVDALYITQVHTVVEDADAYFPAISDDIWELSEKSAPRRDETSGLEFEFAVYRRK